MASQIRSARRSTSIRTVDAGAREFRQDRLQAMAQLQGSTVRQSTFTRPVDSRGFRQDRLEAMAQLQGLIAMKRIRLDNFLLESAAEHQKSYMRRLVNQTSTKHDSSTQTEAENVGQALQDVQQETTSQSKDELFARPQNRELRLKQGWHELGQIFKQDPETLEETQKTPSHGSSWVLNEAPLRNAGDAFVLATNHSSLEPVESRSAFIPKGRGVCSDASWQRERVVARGIAELVAKDSTGLGSAPVQSTRTVCKGDSVMAKASFFENVFSERTTYELCISNTRRAQG